MNDLLSQLSQICSKLYDQTSPLVGSGSGVDSDILDFLLPFPELTLDIRSPDYLVNILARAGAPESLARELSEIHAKSSEELAEHYLQNYRDACSEVVGATKDDQMKRYLRLQRAACRMYKRTIASWETSLVRSVTDRFCTEDVKDNKESANRSSFNTNFGPILEEVFKENPFPSLPIRRALAQKSGMSIGQINVWFQNHRSRARKEGKVITKSSRKAPKMNSNQNMQASMQQRQASSSNKSISDCETVVGSDCEKGSSSLDKDKLFRPPPIAFIGNKGDPFAYSSPPHAFPAPYRPKCKEDPSSCGSERCFSFPYPTWRRVPSSISSLPENGDIPATIKSFSTLKLDEDSSLQHAADLKESSICLSKEAEVTAARNGWNESVYPIVTHTSPAPLPALITRLLKRQTPRTSVTKLSKEAEQIANSGYSLVTKWLSFQTSFAKESEAQVRPCTLHEPETNGNVSPAGFVQAPSQLQSAPPGDVERRNPSESSSSLTETTINSGEGLQSDHILPPYNAEDSPSEASNLFGGPEFNISELPDMPTFNIDDVNIPPPSFDCFSLPSEFSFAFPAFPDLDNTTYPWSPSAYGTDDAQSVSSVELGSPPELRSTFALSEPAVVQDPLVPDSILLNVLEDSFSINLDSMSSQQKGHGTLSQECSFLLQDTNISF
ncbi:hypothetical protein ACEPAH_990 [Sanghuangporus vaninii]